ncbi:class C sortase [Faecalicoccus pleomorphus]|uniref:class C sortase n=1 Tax=Faecalicoccus pleomorphus TaxID=1323 RepID=UPI00232B2B53|nr:class C sortase [Faecalicoccus pleomorphus]MDB7985759.1 class C sortase [Faecalicoccus pleomorphus]MDB7991230.1 class C sortase [Faecalicoccus pleomorphus]
MKYKEKNKQIKKNPFTILVPIMIFIIGAGIFLYPAISNFITSANHDEVIHTYAAKISEFSQEEIDSMWNDAIIYNDNLAGDPLHDPFVAGSGYVIPENYNEVLNPNGDGVMCSIEIPKIDVYLPVYHGTSEEVLAKGAGHIEATSLPSGGINRHSVISAHRGLPSSLLFTRLDELEKGDIFNIHILDEIHSYEVDQIEVILPEELSSLRAEPDKDLITLLTCTPYGVNTHRLLVRGHRVEYVEPKEEARDDNSLIPSWLEEYMLSILIGIILILIIGIIFVLRLMRKRK